MCTPRQRTHTIDTHSTKASRLVTGKSVSRADQVDKARTSDWYPQPHVPFSVWHTDLNYSCFLKITLFHSFSCLKNYAMLFLILKALTEIWNLNIPANYTEIPAGQSGSKQLAVLRFIFLLALESRHRRSLPGRTS